MNRVIRIKCQNILRTPLAICFFLMVTGYELRAQINSNVCRDTITMLPYFSCQGYYEPVCGCNGKTYRNECYAKIRDGVQSYEPGICDPVALDLYPNPIVETLNFFVALKDKGNVRVVIFDLYGQKFFERTYQNIKLFNENMGISDFHGGIYYLFAESGGNTAIAKFAKVEID